MSALYAPTWYDDTGITPPTTSPAASVSGQRFDVAILGGGLAGLVTLLKLSEAGVKAVLLEGRQIASGASGRNGGFCTPGWAASHAQISRLSGAGVADQFEALATQGVSWMRAKMAEPGYEASGPVEGELMLSLWPSDEPPGQDERLLDQAKLQGLLSSRRYKSGRFTPHGVHFHPLNFMRSLATEAMAKGGTIVENARVEAVARERAGFALSSSALPSPVQADRVVMAGGGYSGRETGFSAKHLLPVRTYIGVTGVMPEILDRHIKANWAIADTRRAGNYYRRLPDGRLLWGMSITAFGTLQVSAIERMVLRDMASMYPEMAKDMKAAGVGIDRAWAGNMAYARHYMPYVFESEPGQFVIAGFGGHGMNTAPAAALALVDAMLGQKERLDPFAAIPRQRVFGQLGLLAAEATYRRMRSFDWLHERLT